MPAYDALIIGGGPAGATAGTLLARAGLRVAIIEKASFPRRKVCGEFISATSLSLLFELGVGEAFLCLAGPEIKRIGLFMGEACVEALMPRVSEGGGWGRALGREQLDLLLLDAATRAGAKVLQPWKAVRFDRSGERWACTIADDKASREVSARLVIAANGSWERGPFPLSSLRSHRDSDLLAFKAHFRNADLAADLMPLFVFPGGYGGMVHSDAGRISLSCCIRRDSLKVYRSPGPAGEAVLQHIQKSCRGVHEALRNAKASGTWLAAGPIRPGIRQRYVDGVFFAGNIAGEAHPLIAEGISMAMQSSSLLSHLLTDGALDPFTARGEAEIGRIYAAQWSRAFSLRLHAAAVFAHLAVMPAAARALRPILSRLPQILTLGARFAGKSTPLSGKSTPLFSLSK